MSIKKDVCHVCDKFLYLDQISPEFEKDYKLLFIKKWMSLCRLLLIIILLLFKIRCVDCGVAVELWVGMWII